jgi:hypothetical protein
VPRSLTIWPVDDVSNLTVHVANAPPAAVDGAKFTFDTDPAGTKPPGVDAAAGVTSPVLDTVTPANGWPAAGFVTLGMVRVTVSFGASSGRLSSVTSLSEKVDSLAV